MLIFFKISSVLLFFLLFYLLIVPILRGAPYLPSEKEAVKRMIKLAGVKKGEKMIDLGSGDGRIVIEFAKRGVIAYGVEINPILVWLSRRKIRKAGLEGNAVILRGSFWSKDLSGFDIVTVYGIPRIMKKLGKKLGNELRPSARVISYPFRFLEWKAVKEEKEVYLYRFKSVV